MKPNDTCEARIGGDWVSMDIETVLQNGASIEMRCKECHGPVRAHKRGTTGQAAHFEHMQSHSGCERSNMWDRTSHSRHPLAIA